MSDESAKFIRSNELLSRHDSRLVIVDVQEKLIQHIPVAQQLVANCRRLILGARIVGVPLYATEQYRKGLGATVPELDELLPERPDKLCFSCAEVLGWGTAAEQSDDRDKVVLAGIEAHVCVQQTALDLMSLGYRVYVAADAAASRHKHDWKVALRRMESGGVVITTTEAVLFEWCGAAGTPEFKEISRLVTGRE